MRFWFRYTNYHNIYANGQVCTSKAYMYPHTYICVCVCAFCMDVCMYECKSIYLPISGYICMYVYIYTYVYIEIYLFIYSYVLC